MVSEPQVETPRQYWFVGATHAGKDLTSQLVSEGVWRNGHAVGKQAELVRSMRPGDQIAIKAAYTRKRDLPFNNNDQTVSVMAIKAIGTITSKPKDGHTVEVDWTPLEKPQEWYFYTYQRAVWRVVPDDDWRADALIAFAFDGKPQDVDRFRNSPYWRKRFGDKTSDDGDFSWTPFYEEFADKLLEYRNRRSELLDGIYEIAGRVERLDYLQDKCADGSTGKLKDICPFTVFGMFNRGLTDENRKAVASELRMLLGVEQNVPDSFDGIPLLNNMNSTFFGHEGKRSPDDIGTLWRVFELAIKNANSEETVNDEFINAFDDAISRYQVGWKLTVGLFWIRPWSYATLDKPSRDYITKKLNIKISMTGPRKRCSGEDYAAILSTLQLRFDEEMYPVHSFPELSFQAWHRDSPPTTEPTIIPDHDVDGELVDLGIDDTTQLAEPPNPIFSLQHIINDGCFHEVDLLEMILQRLRRKKNIILQGPPGTGKTWLAKRLAWALMQQKSERRVRAVQFHPNLSYEDFVRGWRPSGDGKLSLVDGPFMEMITAAVDDPKEKHVIVIEEINRGNPAQVFGEMLTLMEADKRTPDSALELCYSREKGERIHIPDNLYIIGTMNIADRSLALVDLAFRRRFAFVELKPVLGKRWRDWVNDKCGIDTPTLSEIEERIVSLNETIAGDLSLGTQYRIGHSFVTPPFETPIDDARQWFCNVVETEIGPLLEEYWFDAIDKATEAKQKLLEGFVS